MSWVPFPRCPTHPRGCEPFLFDGKDHLVVYPPAAVRELKKHAASCGVTYEVFMSGVAHHLHVALTRDQETP